MGMRRVHLTMRTEGITAFSNRYGVVVCTGENDTKTISVDANLFENSSVFVRKRISVDRAVAAAAGTKRRSQVTENAIKKVRHSAGLFVFIYLFRFRLRHNQAYVWHRPCLPLF